MRSIWQDFSKGGSRERLAIASDIFSIVGVSFATVGAALYTNRHAMNPATVIAVAIMTLILLAVLALLLAVLLWFDSEVEAWATGTAPRVLFKVSYRLFGAAIVLGWVVVAAEFLFNTHWPT